MAKTDRLTTARAKFELEQSMIISDERGALASGEDVKRILGNLDDAKLLAILALRPTIVDVEEASLWLAGDADIFGAGQPLKLVPGDIVAIVTSDEEEEPRPG